METKICTDCGEEKDIICFYQNEKYVRRQCKPCQEERRKIYTNSEKGRATIMKYMNEHKEESKKYREENKEHFKEISRRYIQEHKEEIKEKKHERVKCECGAELSRASLNQNRHKKVNNIYNILIQIQCKIYIIIQLTI